jgi:hypothetical protein
LENPTTSIPHVSEEPSKMLDERMADEKAGVPESSDIENDSTEKQYGVEKIRAITSAWSYKAPVGTYIL